MKSILIFWSCILISASTKCQIIFETSYPTASVQYGLFFIANLGNDNYKYIQYDCINDQVTLYNLDHTPYLSNIQVPVNSDSCIRFSIGFVTNTLFDCDSSTIEFALLPESAIYPFQVYRTDGTLLFSKDSVYGYWCYGCNEASIEVKTIVNTPSGAKLFLHYPWSEPDSVLIYSLCGTLPVTDVELNTSNSFLNIFPNPNTGKVNFQCSQLKKLEKYTVEVYNSLSELVFKVPVNTATSYFELDFTNLGAGIYYYSLRASNKLLQRGKIVITK